MIEYDPRGDIINIVKEIHKINDRLDSLESLQNRMTKMYNWLKEQDKKIGESK